MQQNTRGVEKGIQSLTGKWAGRFIWASVVQGVLAVAWTLFIVNPWTVPAAAMVIASGSAGTWLTVGYTLYVMIGVVAVAVTAVFYMYIERILGRVYQGATNYLAWVHLILMNAGVIGATWLMMVGGYLGGAALLPVKSGGLGWNGGQVHENILQYYTEPVFVFVLLAIAGVMAGGLGYLLSARNRQPISPQ